MITIEINGTHIRIVTDHQKSPVPYTISIGHNELVQLSEASKRRKPSLDAFLGDWIAGNITVLDEIGAVPFCPASPTDLHVAYLHWCKNNGEFRPLAMNQLIESLSRRPGWNSRHRDRYIDPDGSTRKKRQRMIEPSDADIDAHLKAGGRDFQKKPKEHIASWSTRCFFAFRRAVGEQ